MLGSNVLAIPLMVLTAYFVTRARSLADDHEKHEGHQKGHAIRVDGTAVTVQALPNL